MDQTLDPEINNPKKEIPVSPMSTSQSTQNTELRKVSLLRFLAKKRVSYNFLNFRLEDGDIINNISGSSIGQREPGT